MELFGTWLEAKICRPKAIIGYSSVAANQLKKADVINKQEEILSELKKLN